jgi:hypothetical protein
MHVTGKYSFQEMADVCSCHQGLDFSVIALEASNVDLCPAADCPNMTRSVCFNFHFELEPNFFGAHEMDEHVVLTQPQKSRASID